MGDQTVNLAESEECAARILERMNKQVVERQRLEAAKPDRGRQKTTQVEQHRENQEALIEILEDVLTNPLLSHALGVAGVAPAQLHEAAARGAWDSEILPAITRAHEVQAESRPDGLNSVTAADEQPTRSAERQVEYLAATTLVPTEADADEQPGIWGRLRGLADRRSPGVAPEPSDPVVDLPEALRRRYAFHVSDDRRSVQLFEKDAKVAAITLDAKSISTPHDGGAVIGDVIALARDRGWQALKVRGTADFRDAIWLEANKLGLAVEHEPSSSVRASFEKWDRERPASQVQQGQAPKGDGLAPRQAMDLATAFMTKSPEERLADPRLRNAQLELMVGIRTAEKELRRPIGEMPEVAQALTAAIREQLVQGRVFEAPFVKPSPVRATSRQVATPRIEADRIPPPRP